jgi:hypothetical protein
LSERRSPSHSAARKKDKKARKEDAMNIKVDRQAIEDAS